MCAVLVAVLCTFARAEGLISNGSFEEVKDGKVVGWGVGKGATVEAEGENHFLRLKVETAGEAVMVFRAVPVPKDVGAVELKYRVRYEGIVRGKENYFDGRIMMNFKDGSGNAVKPSPGAPNFKGTSKGWVERSQRFRVPTGAAVLEMNFALFKAEAGQLDIDDVSLTTVSVTEMDAAEEAARVKEAARIAALPKPKPQVPVPAADRLPAEIRVVGNELKTADGKSVWLQGVAIPSLEWSAGGDHTLQSIGVAIKDWKCNCIRLPIRENFWAGKGPYQNDGGMKYRQLVEDAVNLCAGSGVYLVIDLHDFRAPEAKHAAFWKEMAGRYKDHPAVLFELFNEPHDLPWEVWRNGGEVTDKKTSKGVAAENKEVLTTFKTIGMQALVDAVRGQGARNVVIAGGLDWSYDLSGVINGFALTDPNGNGVVYSSHVYPWKSDWQGKFLNVAAQYPLFLGEVGADEKKMDFIPADRQEDPHSWAPDVLGVIQKHRLNWTAWDFHPKSTPRVIADWEYTPTPFWGAYVKRALAGERFEVKRLR